MEPQSNLDLPTRRRRWFGGLCLLGALTMLAMGEFVLPGHLGAVGFLWYWLVCFVLTMLAIYAALAELRAVGIKSRLEQRDLMMETLRDIEKKKQAGEADNDGKAREK